MAAVNLVLFTFNRNISKNYEHRNEICYRSISYELKSKGTNVGFEFILKVSRTFLESAES